MFINSCTMQLCKLGIIWSKHSRRCCPWLIHGVFRKTVNSRWDTIPAPDGVLGRKRKDLASQITFSVLRNLELNFLAWKKHCDSAVPVDPISSFCLCESHTAESSCLKSWMLRKTNSFSSYSVCRFKGFIPCCVQRDIICESIDSSTKCCNYMIIKCTEPLYYSLYIKDS